MPPFDSKSPAPASTILPPERVPMVPTWDPAAPSKDADAAVIAPAETNGEYGTLDGSSPAALGGTAATWPSEKLLGGTEPATGLDEHEHRGQ